MSSDGVPVDLSSVPSSVLDRLRWYRRAAIRARVLYRLTELLVLLLAAAIPVLATITNTPWVGAMLGGAIAVLSGMRQLFRWHGNWLLFTQGQLKVERALNLYIAGVHPYDGKETATALLVTHVEDIVAEQIREWHEQRNVQRNNVQVDK